MHPILIVGVALAGLPILLHLVMKREPKRLPFPALRFLKQRQKTNQRKMRLRHFLLLAMRVLLIALFALTLYQPTLDSTGGWMSGEQPVAAVFVLDTTPSTGYRAADKTRLDDARKRTLDLLDDLPPGSKVAVIDTADPTAGGWEPSVGDARRRIDGFTQPRGGGQPVSAGLAAAYQLLRAADSEADTAEGGPIPRLVAVFSDRTTACWDAARSDDLVKLRDAVPPPAVAHLFADVGADQPADVAITAADFRPQAVPRNQTPTLAVTVQAIGADVATAVVRCRLDGTGTPDRKEVANLRAGTPQLVTFTFRDLKPGFHQAEVSLETDDGLTFDNVRYATIRVGEARKILTVSDDPDDAFFWQLALKEKGDFACDVTTPAAAGDFTGYEAVCLLGVADPGRPLPDGKSLWTKLSEYVGRGGKVLVIPGANAVTAAYDASNGVLPGKLARVIDATAGAVWAVDDKALRHPLIAPFRGWKAMNIDFLKNPRRAWKYWAAEAPPEHVVVSYNDDPDPAKWHPAVLERTSPNGGKVVMLTVRMDPGQDWHNYWELAESSWGVVFPDLLVKYLAGDTAAANFQYPTGQTVAIRLPKPAEGKPLKLVLEGPGVSGPDATPSVAEGQVEYRLPMDRTLTAGNYVLRTEDKSWAEAFSINPSADESNLEKVPTAAIEVVCGPNSVVPAGKELAFRDALDLKFNQPLDLFPWLLIGVLFLFAAEGLASNRFYRARSG